ncbi:MAG: rhomboid family intramembrane serine protease [Myxococcaceae bacterium]
MLPSHPEGVHDATLQEIFSYWEEHPYLEASDRFKHEVLNPRAVAMLEDLRQQAVAQKRVPDEDTLKVEQARFTVMTDHAVKEMDEGAMRRFSLVPARGLKQLGWLTHMFLHFGWMHILGNLFFFYLVGPLLEDVWGRKLFTGFYLLGGLSAGFAHFCLDTSSTSMMAGASGAIAACIGAFTFRYAARRVEMGYLIWMGVRIWRGTKLVPAWVWGGFWFVSEVMSFLTTDGNSGVAVMAHMGGFAFGFALAVGLKVSGVEKRVGSDDHAGDRDHVAWRHLVL